MENGYWQVVAEYEALENMELFTPYGKRRYKVMPMWDLNTAPTFVSMIMNLKMKWDTLAK